MPPRNRTLAVGIITFVAIVVSGLAIFFLKSDFFQKKYTLYTRFKDVIGLTEGSAVRLSGRFVGTLTRLDLIEVDGDPVWKLTLEVQERFQSQIRENSIATAQTQGLLGKKYVNLSLGAAGKKPLNDGALVASKDGIDVAATIEKATGVLEKIDQSAAHITKILSRVAEGEALGDVETILENLAKVSKALNEGDGLARQLIYKTGEKGVDARLNGILENVEAVLAEVRSGDGSAHRIIYGNDAAQTISNVNDATASLKQMMAELAEGGEDKASVVANLNAVAESLKRITVRIESGEGTLGALLEDPTVYQDLKTLIGGAQRSAILRAVIRYAISQQEVQPAP